MLKVDNREPVRRLALRQLRNSKRMNAVIVLSIILTCVMFTALVVIGGSLVNGFQQETMRQVGGNRMAGLKYVLPEDYEKVKNDPAVRDVVCRSIVGFAGNEEFKNISVEVNCSPSNLWVVRPWSQPTWPPPRQRPLPCSVSPRPGVCRRQRMRLR